MTVPPLPDPAPSNAGQAVFVSDAPRRARVVRWVARIGALLAVAYVVLTAGAMVGASWVPHVSLPGVGPVTLEQHPGATPGLGPTAEQLPTPNLSHETQGTVRTGTTVASVPSPRAGQTGATTPTTTNGSGASSVSTTSPANGSGQARTTTTRPSTKDTTPPGRSGSAPGHTTSTVPHGH